MSLKNLKFNTDTVKTLSGDFVVRGLGLDDIKFLFSNNAQQLKLVFDQASNLAKAADEIDYVSFAAALIHLAPDVVTTAIACANDEADDDGIMAARRLPMAVQIDAIEKIGRLTFETEGGPKKVFEIVMRMAKGAQGMLPNVPTQLKNGSLESAGK
jgi:hypothetical protein